MRNFKGKITYRFVDEKGNFKYEYTIDDSKPYEGDTEELIIPNLSKQELFPLTEIEKPT